MKEFASTQRWALKTVSFRSTTPSVRSTSAPCAKTGFTPKTASVNVVHHAPSPPANPGATGCVRFDSELDSNTFETLECPQCQDGYVKKNGQCEVKVSCSNGKVDHDNVCVGLVLLRPDQQLVQRSTRRVWSATRPPTDASNAPPGFSSTATAGAHGVRTTANSAPTERPVQRANTTTPSLRRRLLRRANVATATN